ncbi:MAG: hypothetical protein AAB426_00950 [Myxococcota bacterium]
MFGRSRLVAVLLLLQLGMASTAQAYLPPADFIVRMLADKRRRIGAVDMSILLQTELADATVVEERLYLKFPERLRWATQDDPERVRVERQGVRAMGTADKLTRLSGRPDDLMAVFMMPDGKTLEDTGDRLIAAIKAAGVDMSVVTLARQEREVAFVIGAEPWERERAQVWIDKNRFLPVRWILNAAAPRGTKWVETRLLEYGSATSGDWFPQVVERYEGGKLVSRASVVKIDINQNVPETLFDIP